MNNENPLVRRATLDDVPTLSPLVNSLEMFPLDVRLEMIGNSTGIFLIAEGPIGFLYAVPEPLTEGTWNMLALGVAPDHHRKGLGRALVAAAEPLLRDQGARLLIVDTSGADDFAPARAFYKGLGYAQVAVIPDYWAQGDDKVIFAHPLG